MTRFTMIVRVLAGALVVAPATIAAQQPQGAVPAAAPAPAQPQRTPRQDSLRAANRLDSEGKTTEARALFAVLLASAPDDLARAQVHRAIAMSHAFDGDCANTVKHERMVMDYWKSREATDPQNAFYMQGEMANEAARVCIDNGQLDEAERLYREGRELGLKEPDPRTHPRSLWEYRWAHAMGRLAARRGNAKAAGEWVAKARAIIDSDDAMASDQRRYLPYLEGYVALYAKDLATAESKLKEALGYSANANDPYFHWLLAETYAQQGKGAEAKAMYQLAYDKATGHNPPAAFVRPNARKKLGL